MASYQTLARYDDDCTRKCRVRNMDDIRSRLREALIHSRSQSRCIKFLLQRRTLVEILRDDLFYDSDTDSQSPRSSSDQDDTSNSPWRWPVPECSSANTSQDEVDSIRCTPSPSGSLYSLRSATSSPQIDTTFVPECFLQNTISTSCRNKPKPRMDNEARSKLLKGALLKTTKRHIINEARTRAELNTLKFLLAQCSGDRSQTGLLLYHKWSVLMFGIQSDDLDVMKESFHILTSLISSNLIQPETVLHMLQHGLVFYLRDIFWKPDIGVPLVCELISKIADFIPECIPYMIELMANSKILTDMVIGILGRDNTEVDLIVGLHHSLIITLLMQHFSNQKPKPLIPEVLLRTGVSQATLDSYSPTSTLLKLVTPQLVGNIITKCLSQNLASRNQFINTGLDLLANILRLMASIDSVNSKTLDWIVQLLVAFKISGLQDDASIQGHRSRDFSRHLSRANHLNQFMMFFDSYYNQLMLKYKQFITEEHESKAIVSKDCFW